MGDGAPRNEAGGLPRAPSGACNDDFRIQANKNRLVQVAETGGRKLFGKERKETFLEWFAATCNVKLSATKAGVCWKTVYRHRMQDAAFAAAWDVALQQGYARLEARLLQEAHAPRPSPSTAFGGPPPPDKLGADYVVRGDLDDPEVEESFDPQLALAILREQKRNLNGGFVPKRQRTTARTATNAEVIATLVKRLKVFAVRANSEPDPAATSAGPTPRSGEEQ